MAELRILLVTNMFPDVNPHYLYQGNFVKEQMESVQQVADVEYSLHVIRGFEGRGEYLRSVVGINRRVRQSPFDVIHVHYGLSGMFLLTPFNGLAKRTVLTLHGGDILEEQGKRLQVPLVRLISRRAREVIVVNNEMRRRLPGVRTEVVPCGVDLGYFRPKRGGRSGSVKRIAFGGNPARRVKGYSLYRAVLAELRAANVPVEEVVIHGLAKRQVREALRSASCLLLTSESEGSPQIVKESIACGTPVVSVDVGDVGEILRDTGGGAVVPGRDPAALAGCVNDVCSTSCSTEVERWREGLRSHGYDAQSVAERVVQIYRRVASGPGGAV